MRGVRHFDDETESLCPLLLSEGETICLVADADDSKLLLLVIGGLKVTLPSSKLDFDVKYCEAKKNA